MAKKSSKPSKTMVREAHELAVLLGWSFLNPQEKQLIELLRKMTFEGRNCVIHAAIALHTAHPWRDGQAWLPHNTQTSFPAGDNRYFHPLKES